MGRGRVLLPEPRRLSAVVLVPERLQMQGRIVMGGLPAVEFRPPKAMRELLDAALTHGRDFKVTHGDDGTSPFVTVVVGWFAGEEIPTTIRASWHTRGTGTYRLFSITGAWYGKPTHDLPSLAAAQRMIVAGGVP